MSYPIRPDGRHKLFISYYHADDEFYRDSFERQFSQYYITKSVQVGDIDTDLSTEYIRRLIREGYLADASVIVVLVGPNTKHRKHVDWEISAALEPYNGRSGLMGILLPEFPMHSDRYNIEDLPARLADNVESQYADIYTWADIYNDVSRLTQCINHAFRNRLFDSLVRNSRRQMQSNTGP